MLCQHHQFLWCKTNLQYKLSKSTPLHYTSIHAFSSVEVNMLIYASICIQDWYTHYDVVSIKFEDKQIFCFV
jgi:hypothetical protein